MSAYISKYYSNCGKKNVFCKTLMSSGIFGRQGKTYTISNDTMNKNIKKFENTDIVIEHNDNKVVGKVLEVFCNGSEGVIDRNGGVYDRIGWTAIYELDEDKLVENGLSLDEAGKLDLSTSYYPVFSNKKDLYNGANVDNEVIGFNVNNVAIVKKGRYNETRGIINNSEDKDMINLIFTNSNDNQEDISNSMDEKDKKDDNTSSNSDNNISASKEENKQTSNESSNDTKQEDNNKENSEQSPDTKQESKDNKPVEEQPQTPCQQPQQSGALNIDFAQLTTGLAALTSVVSQIKAFTDTIQGNTPVQQPVQQPAPVANQPQETGIQAHEHNEDGSVATTGVEEHTHDEAGNASDNVAEHSHEGGETIEKAENVPEKQSNEKKASDAAIQWTKEHQNAINIMKDNLTPEIYQKLFAAIINGDKQDSIVLQNSIEPSKEIVQNKEEVDKIDNNKFNFYKFYSF